MEKFFKTPTKTSTEKQKRFINPLFLDKYGIGEVSGKGICVVCSKELAEESLKPNKLQRNMETHANIELMAKIFLMVLISSSLKITYVEIK